MEIKINSTFLNADTTQNKELCQIKDEGTIQQGKYGTQYNFKIETESGRELTYTPNNPALKTFIKSWGKDSKAWVGKMFYAEHVKMMVKGELKTIINPIPETVPTTTDEVIKA